jgi:sugar phosphate isomerase/epimerase
MTSRRLFLKQSALTGIALTLPLPLFSADRAVPKISLAQWSMNRAIKDGSIKAEDFASITKNQYGVNAIEYVNGFYTDHKKDMAYWADMLKRSDNEGVTNLLIMVDAEGDLGDLNQRNRKKAVENHYGWVDIAKKINCHSIRVNAFGTGSREKVKTALVDGMGRLAEYGAEAGINIVIENHGLYSSEADFIVEMIKEVNSPYLGTLPDFGNWCTSVKWGGTSDNSCANVYDVQKGVAQFMPYAKGVSAKTYDFDADGNQPRLDYPALLKTVKATGYDGYIGIEYEGNNLSEPDGIMATKRLIERVWAELD